MLGMLATAFRRRKAWEAHLMAEEILGTFAEALGVALQTAATAPDAPNQVPLATFLATFGAPGLPAAYD